MNEAAIDLATVPMLTSVGSSATVFIESNGTIGRITLEQLKTALNAL